MKPKVNSRMAMISFYYLFLLHQLYADWRHFSASINEESTKDITGASGKNSHLGKNTGITEPNCCGTSAGVLTPQLLNEILKWHKSLKLMIVSINWGES